jgi:hypothetical protein
MKSLLIVLALAGVTSAQTSKPAPPKKPEGWLIQSWDDGVLTVLHQGLIYKAKCAESVVVAPNAKGHLSPGCTLAIDLIGREIQPPHYWRPVSDEDGWIVDALSAEGSLCIARWRRESYSSQTDHYTITSVRPTSARPTAVRPISRTRAK